MATVQVRSEMDSVPLCLSPQPSTFFPRLSLQLAELLHERERVLRISEPVALPDNLSVHERVVLQEHVPEQPAVAVTVLVHRIVQKNDPLPVHELLREGRSLSAEVLNGLVRVDRLRSIDADQADLLDPLADANPDRVAVDDSGAGSGFLASRERSRQGADGGYSIR